MNRFTCISIAALLFFSAASAQEKRYLYIDSSLLRNETSYDEVEVVPADEEAGTPLEDHTLNTPVLNEQGTDTTLFLNGLIISPDSVRRWKQAKEFGYMKYLDSLLKDKQEKEKKKVKEGSRSTGPGFMERLLSSPLLKVLLWSLAGFFVLFIVYRLFLAEGVFRRDTKSAKTDKTNEKEESITAETDFNALVNQALKENNFRQAVRYLYLGSLHKLSGKGLVQLAPDKTNYQYVRELKSPSLQNDFASLTLNYDYVWYGEIEIEQDIYQKIENGFKDFNKKL